MAGLSDVLEITELEKVAGGFVFTEGPLWHADGFYYFVDIRQNLASVPHGDRSEAGGGAQDHRGQWHDIRSARAAGSVRGRRADGHSVGGRWLGDEHCAIGSRGKKLNRPNDVICHSNGSLYFTDPGYRVPMAERELDAAVYRIAPDGSVSLAVPVEYPNGLALSPDERTLYIANTRWAQYVHAVELDAAGAYGAAARVCRYVSWTERMACRMG